VQIFAGRRVLHDQCCGLLEKELEYNEAVHKLFIDFKKAYDSGRR
jgi:hypothetical protein